MAILHDSKSNHNSFAQQFVGQWGSNGSSDGQFNFPNRIAVDTNDFIYVTDDGNRRVQKFITTGQFAGKIAEGQLSFPVGIGLDSSNNIYVTESGTSGNPSRVDKFNTAGQLVTSWGLWAQPPVNLTSPRA